MVREGVENEVFIGVGWEVGERGLVIIYINEFYNFCLFFIRRTFYLESKDRIDLNKVCLGVFVY